MVAAESFPQNIEKSLSLPLGRCPLDEALLPQPHCTEMICDFPEWSEAEDREAAAAGSCPDTLCCATLGQVQTFSVVKQSSWVQPTCGWVWILPGKGCTCNGLCSTSDSSESQCIWKDPKISYHRSFSVTCSGIFQRKKQINTSIGYRVSIWANLSWKLCLPSLWGSEALMSKSRTALGSRPAAESPRVPWKCQAPCGPWAHQVESRFRTWLCRFCYLDFPFSPNFSHSVSCDT